jgi:tripartite ATP-independent transporter DctM subunit
MVTLTMLAIALCLFMLRVPVSISMGIATVIGYLILPMPINVLATRMVDGVDGFALLAVPFFILAGNVMNFGGVTEKIFDFARAVFGWMRGGLAQVNIVASVIFAGMSGSALADLAGLGAVEMKAMKSNGYPVGFSAAVTLASCAIGPIIPPSIILVIYGLATNVSIGRLFLGGFLAGLIIAACLMVFVYVYMRVTGSEWAKPDPFVARKVISTGFFGLPALLAPVIILGSLVLGVTTPSELGSIATGYAVLVGLFYRKLSWARMGQALVQTVVMSAVIMYLFAIASAMNLIIARERVASDAADLMAAHVTSPVLGIILINLFLVVIGMFIEGPVAILIVSPILLEVVKQFGMDPVQFGIMLSFNLLIGMMTPPVGIGLFVGGKVAGIRPEQMLRAIVPFYLPLAAGLMIIAFVPAVTTWLPNLVFGVAP